MSRRTYKAKGYTVVCGWDVQAQTFTLTIYAELHDDPAFSSDDEQQPYPLSRLRNELYDRGLPFPTSLFEDLTDDLREGRDRVTVNYGDLDLQLTLQDLISRMTGSDQS